VPAKFSCSGKLYWAATWLISNSPNWRSLSRQVLGSSAKYRSARCARCINCGSCCSRNPRFTLPLILKEAVRQHWASFPGLVKRAKDSPTDFRFGLGAGVQPSDNELPNGPKSCNARHVTISLAVLQLYLAAWS